MTSPLIIVPRLHRELAFAAEFPVFDAPPLPSEALALSPGLPATVVEARAYTPDYPWSPPEAAACVTDFERLAREGAHGSPVQAMALSENSVEGLSRAEQRALADWKREMGDFGSVGTPVAVPSGGPESDDALRRKEAKRGAQRVLLLAWLREKQALELRALEERVGRNSLLLAGWLGDGVAPEAALSPSANRLVADNLFTVDSLSPKDGLPAVQGLSDGLPAEGLADRPAARSALGSAAPLSQELDLPPWRAVLEAAVVFLPSDAILVVTEHDMTDAILSLAEPVNPGVFSSKGDLPQGWAAFAVSVSRLLGRATSADERPMIFLCPRMWAELECS